METLKECFEAIRNIEENSSLEKITCMVNSGEVKKVLTFLAQEPVKIVVQSWCKEPQVYKNKGNFFKALYPYHVVAEIYRSLYIQEKEQRRNRILDFTEKNDFFSLSYLQVSKSDREKFILNAKKMKDLKDEIHSIEKKISESASDLERKKVTELESNNNKSHKELENLEREIEKYEDKQPDYQNKVNERIKNITSSFLHSSELKDKLRKL